MPITRPTAAHAAILSEIAHETFADTFVGKAYYTREIVDGYATKAFAPDLLRTELTTMGIHYFLLEHSGDYIGYTKLVKRAPAACVKDARSLYLERLYLKKFAQRQGHGTKLLHAACDEGIRLGFDCLWLSVWEHNHQAQSFYAKHGFHRVGEWDWPFESGGIRYVDLDYILVKRISTQHVR